MDDPSLELISENNEAEEGEIIECSELNDDYETVSSDSLIGNNISLTLDNLNSINKNNLPTKVLNNNLTLGHSYKSDGKRNILGTQKGYLSDTSNKRVYVDQQNKIYCKIFPRTEEKTLDKRRSKSSENKKKKPKTNEKLSKNADSKFRKSKHRKKSKHSKDNYGRDYKKDSLCRESFKKITSFKDRYRNKNSKIDALKDKDNLLMQKLLAAGTFKSNKDSEDSGNSDLKCEIGSFSNISSPSYSIIEDFHSPINVYHSPDIIFSGETQDNAVKSEDKVIEIIDSNSECDLGIVKDVDTKIKPCLTEIKEFVKIKEEPLNIMQEIINSHMEEDLIDNRDMSSEKNNSGIKINEENLLNLNDIKIEKNDIHITKSVIPSQDTNSDDEDDLRLRLAALRSAFINKHKNRIEKSSKVKPKLSVRQMEQNITTSLKKCNQGSADRSGTTEPNQRSADNAYYPSDQVSPLSPSSSYSFSLDENINKEIQEMDMEISEIAESETLKIESNIIYDQKTILPSVNETSLSYSNKSKNPNIDVNNPECSSSNQLCDVTCPTSEIIRAQNEDSLKTDVSNYNGHGCYKNENLSVIVCNQPLSNGVINSEKEVKVNSNKNINKSSPSENNPRTPISNTDFKTSIENIDLKNSLELSNNLKIEVNKQDSNVDKVELLKTADLEKSKHPTNENEDDENVLRARLLSSLENNNCKTIVNNGLNSTNNNKIKKRPVLKKSFVNSEKSKNLLSYNLNSSQQYIESRQKLKENYFVKAPLRGMPYSRYPSNKRYINNTNYFQNRFIISIGDDSDSSGNEFAEGDSTSNKNIITKSVNNKSTTVNNSNDKSSVNDKTTPKDLEKSVDLLLKQVRQLHETKSQSINNILISHKPKSVSENVSPEQNCPTSSAVKHLPKPLQEEYRRLKQKIFEKEKLKKQQKLNVISNKSNINQLKQVHVSATQKLNSGQPNSIGDRPNTKSPVEKSNLKKSDESKLTSLKKKSSQIKIVGDKSHGVDSKEVKLHIGEKESIKKPSPLKNIDKIQIENISAAENHENPHNNEPVQSLVPDVINKNLDPKSLSSDTDAKVDLQTESVSSVTQNINPEPISSNSITNKSVDSESSCETSQVFKSLLNVGKTSHFINKTQSKLNISDVVNSDQNIDLNINSTDLDTNQDIDTKSSSYQITKILCNKEIQTDIIEEKRNVSEKSCNTDSYDSNAGEKECKTCQMKIDNAESITDFESDLVDKRFNVLEIILDVDKYIKEFNSIKSEYSSASTEVARIKHELKRAESNLENCSKKLDNVKKNISEGHKKLLESHLMCAQSEETCLEMGNKLAGANYMLPTVGAELLTQRFAEILKVRKNYLMSLNNNINDSKKVPPVNNPSVEDFNADRRLLVENSSTSSETLAIEKYSDISNKSQFEENKLNSNINRLSPKENLVSSIVNKETLVDDLIIHCNANKRPLENNPVEEPIKKKTKNVHGSSEENCYSNRRVVSTGCDIPLVQTSGTSLSPDEGSKTALNVFDTGMISSESISCVEIKTRLDDKTASSELPKNHLLAYISPLSHLQSGIQRKYGTSEITNPNDILCPYDLRGKCNDEACTYRH